jgi:hypothetical protein
MREIPAKGFRVRQGERKAPPRSPSKCRLKGDGLHRAVLGIVRLHNLTNAAVGTSITCSRSDGLGGEGACGPPPPRPLVPGVERDSAGPGRRFRWRSLGAWSRGIVGVGVGTGPARTRTHAAASYVLNSSRIGARELEMLSFCLVSSPSSP